MENAPRGYHFGDLTKGFIRYLGAHAGAVRGRIDWLKAGKALVDYLVANGTLSLGIVWLSLLRAITDPRDAQEIGAAVVAGAGILNLIRRIMSGEKPQRVIGDPPQKIILEGPTRGEAQA